MGFDVVNCLLLQVVTYLNIAATKVTAVGLANFAESILLNERTDICACILATNSFCIGTGTRSLSIRKTYRESDIMMVLLCYR